MNAIGQNSSLKKGDATKGEGKGMTMACVLRQRKQCVTTLQMTTLPNGFNLGIIHYWSL